MTDWDIHLSSKPAPKPGKKAAWAIAYDKQFEKEVEEDNGNNI